ncbi:hypothetical protein L204_101089 [Cryptococcus depauperatus]|nr:epsin [Cryptococcus depauperatus CBS 7855]
MASSLQHLGKGALRVAKNYTKGYTDTQTKVREATSNDSWGPSGTIMNEIAQLTYNQNDFVEIMEMLDKRLNDKGKNWRHVFKALTLLDYCLHAGSENVVIYFKDNIYIIKTLKEFVYVDETGKDVGANVRQKAKDITNLLQDESRLREERRSRGAMRDRMLGNIESSALRGDRDYGGPRSPTETRDSPHPKPNRSRNEDDDLRRAIEESKRMSEDEAKRRSLQTQEEDDLKRALRMSEEEAERKRKDQENSTQNALFDDSFNIQGRNAYTQQPDLFAQQTQQMPVQPTGGWPLVDVGWGQQQQLQPQYTSYNPFFTQMQQQQQQEEYMRQQMALQEQQRQQQEWMQQQQYLQQQNTSLLAQPTGYGSNNPFAPSNGQQSQQPQQTFAPQPQQDQSSFLAVPTVNQQSSSPQPQFQAEQPISLEPQATTRPAALPPQLKTNDAQHGQLASLLARGREDGLDTFGNIGNLRIPVGTQFHNSNRLAMQQTGAQGGLSANNPFGQKQNGQGGQGQQGGLGSDQPFFKI